VPVFSGFSGESGGLVRRAGQSGILGFESAAHAQSFGFRPP
jgi:hypothetical protein